MTPDKIIGQHAPWMTDDEPPYDVRKRVAQVMPEITTTHILDVRHLEFLGCARAKCSCGWERDYSYLAAERIPNTADCWDTEKASVRVGNRASVEHAAELARPAKETE